MNKTNLFVIATILALASLVAIAPSLNSIDAVKPDKPAKPDKPTKPDKPDKPAKPKDCKMSAQLKVTDVPVNSTVTAQIEQLKPQTKPSEDDTVLAFNFKFDKKSGATVCPAVGTQLNGSVDSTPFTYDVTKQDIKGKKIKLFVPYPQTQ